MRNNELRLFTTTKMTCYLAIFVCTLYLSIFFTTEFLWWFIGLVLTPLIIGILLIAGVKYEVNEQYIKKWRFNHLVYKYDFNDLHQFNLLGYSINEFVHKNKWLILLLGIGSADKNQIKSYIYGTKTNEKIETEKSTYNAKQLWKIVGNMFFIIFAISIMVFAITRFYSPPNNKNLITVSGKLAHVLPYKGESIQIYLDNNKPVYLYIKRAGKIASLSRSLKNIDDDQISLLIDPSAEYSTGQNEPPHNLIWGIKVNDVVLRSYKDIKLDWQETTHLAGPLFIALILFFYGFMMVISSIRKMEK